MKKYPAKKGFFFIVVMLLLGVFSVCLIGLSSFVGAAVMILVFLYFVWIYFDTFYGIQNDIFFYQSTFFSGKIKIESIHKLEVNKTLWVGLKPAMATNGLIIYYNTYNEVYVAPNDNEGLVKDLLMVNPKIQINRN